MIDFYYIEDVWGGSDCFYALENRDDEYFTWTINPVDPDHQEAIEGCIGWITNKVNELNLVKQMMMDLPSQK